MLLNPNASFELAVRFREGNAMLGEVFTFISGLYFRGKMAYAGAFAPPPATCASALVITPGRGLLPPDEIISTGDFEAIASVSIDTSQPTYVHPLLAAAARVFAEVPQDYPVVLLGSIATEKYLSPLLKIFGERLLFPADFVGRGDMSRGGLMLRSARSGVELPYIPAQNAVRRGQRPPRLQKI